MAEMATAHPGSLIRDMCEETTCPVCLEYFTDPVITECGHNFCRDCLAQPWGDPGTNPTCPECREPVEQDNLRPNRKLANIAEISKKSSLLHVAKWKEVCEAHEEPLSLFCKDDKGPICEVCKKSKEHSEHQVITLEEAAEDFKIIDSAEGACVRHQMPLKLFCRDDEVPICVVCDQEHGNHRVIPVEEAAEEYKKKIQALLQSLEKKRENMKKQNVAEEQKNQKRLKQLEEEKEKITYFFKEMHKFLEEKKRFCLSELADLEKETRKRQEENLTRLCEETSYFSDLIKDVEGKCLQQPISFLQGIRGTLNRCQAGQSRQSPELHSGLDWRFKKDSLNTSVLKKVMEELEGSLKEGLSKYLHVSVTLDPNTANPYLLLSTDLKSVTWEDLYKCPPDNPERFWTMHCVLGRERFTSGKHCWQVEVEPLGFAEEEWALGVARDTVKRNENLSFSPISGIWAVGKSQSNPHAIWAFTRPANTLLTLGSHELKKIWVFLDCNEGCVEFVDADTDNLIFSFPPASFSGEGIRPFFWISTAGAKLKC